MSMTLEDSAQPFVEVPVAGEVFKFGKLSVRDRCRVMNDLKKKRRDQLLDTMKSSGVEASAIVATLSDFDTSEMTEHDFIRHVNTLDGQLAILEIALRKNHPDKVDDVLDKMTLQEGTGSTLPLVASLCGLSMNAPENSDPNPPAAPSETGAAHQTPGTCYGT